MAVTRFLFTASLLLLSMSLLVLASAGDHGCSPKPKSEFGGYDSKPDAYKPKPENDRYGSKSDFGKLKPKNYGYGTKLDVYKPKSKQKETPFPVCIEGRVICKSGPKYYPIEGAVGKITCLGVDERGYKKTTFSIYSGKTDAKGYFFVRLSANLEVTDGLKLAECKAFLENSPVETCKIPTDVNKGITGALLHSYEILHEKKTKLYSLKPFFFTSEPKSAPNGY